MPRADEAPALRVELRPPVDTMHACLAGAFVAAGAEVVIDDPDVVIVLDAKGPSRRRRDLRLLALVDDPSPETVERLLKAGVRGVVDRASQPDAVVRAAHAVARGYAVLPTHATRLAPGLVGSVELTAEEHDWLRLLLDGASVSELAVTVGMGERQLYRRLADVYRRLGAPSRLEALVVFRAQRRRLDMFHE